MATVALNDITIAYDLVGSSPHTLLLIHGHPFNRSMWHPQMAAVVDAGWRSLTPDLRGYGQTTVVPGQTLLSTFAADLASLLDHLAIPQVVLAGLSMGGQIAMEFCRQYPERVQGLLLAATFPQAETEPGRQARHAMADRLLREGMGPYATEVLGKMLAPESIAAFPTVAAHVATMMASTDPVGAAAALRGRAERPSYEPTLEQLRIPGLIVVGDQDAYTTRQDAEGMRSLIPDAELLWLPGVGHMPNLEAVELFNAGLTGLLRRVAAVGD
jgi:pimeloyl-ACP methyl ester carboxylesterase